jgi:hypothetical protein
MSRRTRRIGKLERPAASDHRTINAKLTPLPIEHLRLYFDLFVYHHPPLCFFVTGWIAPLA